MSMLLQTRVDETDNSRRQVDGARLEEVEHAPLRPQESKEEEAQQVRLDLQRRRLSPVRRVLRRR